MNDKKQPDPDKIINQGIYVLCVLFWMILATGLWSAGLPALAGASLGLIMGFILTKVRPLYGKEKGLWKHINHFILTQMNMKSAFTRNKKTPNQELERTVKTPVD